MTSRLFCLFLLLAASLFSSASAQTLWDKAHAGMSPAQVKATYPAAESVDPRLHGTDGADDHFHLPGVQIAGIGFKARFLFAEDRLVGVILQRSDSDKPAHAYRAAAKAIHGDLTARFGPPLSHEAGDGSFITRKGKWSADGVEAWLGFSAWGEDDRTPTMEVGFKAEGAMH